MLAQKFEQELGPPRHDRRRPFGPEVQRIVSHERYLSRTIRPLPTVAQKPIAKAPKPVSNRDQPLTRYAAVHPWSSNTRSVRLSNQSTTSPLARPTANALRYVTISPPTSGLSKLAGSTSPGTRLRVNERNPYARQG